MDLIDELVTEYLFSNDEFSSFLNTKTGEILLNAPEELTGEPEIDWDDDEATEDLVEIPSATPSDIYEEMVRFSNKQPKSKLTQLMYVLNGNNPFRKFKDKIVKLGIADQWYKHEEEFAKNIMQEWLEEVMK